MDWAYVSDVSNTYHLKPMTEGFVQACLREWAYARIWQHSNERAIYLPDFIDDDFRIYQPLWKQPIETQLVLCIVSLPMNMHYVFGLTVAMTRN